MVDEDDWVAQAQLCEDFMVNVVDRLEGWLDRFTAKRTFDLLRAQERHGVRGALYEVGLYYGKYFSILVDAGVRSGSATVGLDTFGYVPQSVFEAGFLTVAGQYMLGRIATWAALGTTLLPARSSDVGTAAFRAAFGGDQVARFVSIDGSHEFDDVVWDLTVADELLAPGGIIAVDDYLHPISLGVTAAADRFLANCADLAPFAYVANKLFLCRPDWADRYRDALRDAILHDQSEPKARSFKQHFDRGASGLQDIEASYTGYRILTVPLY